MKQFYTRLLRLLFGLLLYAVGIIITINAQIGYMSWDVFHFGIAKTFNITLGVASIFVGLTIGIISYLLGEKLGLGTLANMVLIGLFVDLIMRYDFIPYANSFITGLIMMTIGLFIVSLATYYYIGSGFGAGPRDSLMVSLTRKTGWSVGLCRAIIELSATIIGWRLGGMLGVGTIISAFGMAYFIQITFKLLKFDPTEVYHETLNETYRNNLMKKSA